MTDPRYSVSSPFQKSNSYSTPEGPRQMKIDIYCKSHFYQKVSGMTQGPSIQDHLVRQDIPRASRLFPRSQRRSLGMYRVWTNQP